MRDVLPELMEWWRAGETVGVGTVVATFQSAPAPGRRLDAGRPRRHGGRLGLRRLRRGRGLRPRPVGRRRPATPVLERYGVSDDDAFAVGLTCGGILDVYVEKVSRETFPELGRSPPTSRPAARSRWPPSSSTPTRPGSAGGSSYAPTRPARPARLARHRPRADDAVHDDALGLLAAGHNATLTYGPDGERRGEGMRVFVWAFAPKPRMLVFGAIDFAAAVARVGSFLGYHVTVCDARPVFATNSRFPEADEVVVDWPHRYLAAEREAGRIDGRTVHRGADPRPEVRRAAARGRAAAARGGVRRRDGLAAYPRGPARPAARGRRRPTRRSSRLSSPIGLDLGARTPEETAISIAAEIIAGRWGGSGERLWPAPHGRIHTGPGRAGGAPGHAPWRGGSAVAGPARRWPRRDAGDPAPAPRPAVLQHRAPRRRRAVGPAVRPGAELGDRHRSTPPPSEDRTPRARASDSPARCRRPDARRLRRPRPAGAAHRGARPTPTPASRSPTAATAPSSPGCCCARTGAGPFPAVVLNHGYIEPSIYVTGQGMAREQDWLARAGLRRAAHRLPRPRRRRPGRRPRARAPAGLHPRQHQRRPGARAAAVRRRRPDRDARPVDGRRGHPQRAGRRARAGRRRGRSTPASARASSTTCGTSRSRTGPRRCRRCYDRFGTPQAGAGVLPRALLAHLLRPDHRAGADPPRHRRRHLPAGLVAHHAAAARARRGVDSTPAWSTPARTTRSTRAGRTRSSPDACGSSAQRRTRDATVTAVTGPVLRWPRPTQPGGGHGRSELQTRRLDAVRAWTTLRRARRRAPRTLVRPEILQQLGPLGGRDLAPTSPRRRSPTRPRPRRTGTARRSRPRSSGSRPSCGVPPRTATSSSRSPTPRPASCGRTAAG